MADLKGFWKQGNASQWQSAKLAPGEKRKKPQRTKKKRKFRQWSKRRKAGNDNDRFYLCEAWRKLRYQALKNSDGRCECCGASPKDGIQLHVDHIIPRSQCPKRELDITNLQVLCEDCNLGKGAWDQTDWRDRLDLRSSKPLTG